MKRILLLFQLLCITLGIWADFSPVQPSGQAQGSTVIFFDLNLNGQKIEPSAFDNSYQIGAFINGECRAVATVESTASSDKYYQLVVSGNYTIDEEDTDQEITFQIYMKASACTYLLTSDQTVKFGAQATYGGSPSGTDAAGNSDSHVKLSLVYPTNIQIRDISMALNETVTLTDYLTLTPQGATLPLEAVWSVANKNMAVIEDNKLTSKAVGTTTYTLTLPGGPNAEGTTVSSKTYTANLIVNNPATSIEVPVTTYEVYMGQETELNAFLKNAYTLKPEGSTDQVTWQIGDETIIKLNESNAQFVMLKPGVTTMTPVILGSDGVVRLSGAAITITVKQLVQGFTVTVTPDANGTGGTVTLTPVPATASYNIDDYQLIAVPTSGTGTNYGDWNTIAIAHDNQNPLLYTYSADLPGQFTFRVMKGTGVFAESNSVEVPSVISLAQGWQWKSNNFVAVDGNGLSTLFGDDLSEARTQGALLFNDPSWGYVGSMLTSGISKLQMYKTNMTSSKTSCLTGGSLQTMLTIPLQPGWNWVGSPYFYNRELSVALPMGSISEELVIQGKNGSAEYANGQWNGNLTTINSGEGYLVYNPSTSTSRMTWATEVGQMEQGDATAGARKLKTSVWHYDASRFANNMSMVTTLSNLSNPENYTLGAFVDGECRGEGVFIDGRMYVTVHADEGEQVSFMLYNKLTEKYIHVKQTVSAVTRLGSVNAPFKLTAVKGTTGIDDLQSDRSGQSADCRYYDLQGRQVTGSQRNNMMIVRMPDGSVRKVIIK